MSALPNWAENALKYRIYTPPGMQMNRRQVFLSYDHNGNIVKADDFTEFVPVGTVTPTLTHPQKTSNLQTFEPKLFEPLSIESRPQNLPPHALWKSSNKQVSRRDDEPKKSKTPLRLPSQRKTFEISQPLSMNAKSAAAEDVPTLRELISSRQRDRESQVSSYETLSDTRPPPPKQPPPPIPLRQSPKKSSIKRDSITKPKVSSPKAPPERSSIPPAPPLPFSPAVKKSAPTTSKSPLWSHAEEEGSYSRLYVPKPQHTGVKKPSEATYNKLREILAEKANQVLTSKEPNRSALHQELLSKVRKISPVAEN